MLENLKLKTEAFDYLQLPCAIREGTLARLDVQVMQATTAFDHFHIGHHLCMEG